ncbi:chemotaxis protein CheD [Alkalicoccus luteus]|uniref:Probable chemoreceptor glutamine deamidase CheD n=1 Tax=Alkalicoccus luteus TaxID=1237094 RepID=A0A969PP16_9BACI|nr:chemotaxis protein CheD [Alkalicoccus luteus]NJP36329.1 chemotaxis protein CheD [Alkalicoccus luteus]
MSEIIRVGMADMKSAHAGKRLRTTGLGSCVGIIIYDEKTSSAVMAHIMLPDSQNTSAPVKRAKFADTAIEDMINYFLGQRIPKHRLRAKIAGGAQMFSFSNSDTFRIGPRNTEAVKQLLSDASIRIVFEDTGGTSGRTIEFNPEDQRLEIRTVHKGVVTA